MAGYELSPAPPAGMLPGANPLLAAASWSDYGYARLAFENATHLRLRFISDRDGSTLDDVTLERAS